MNQESQHHLADENSYIKFQQYSPT